MEAKDLRIGNYLMKDGIMVTIDARSIFDIWDSSDKYQPILLTEENILKLRRDQQEDFKPIEFQKTPPGERQIENNYYSNWLNDSYRLHLSPSYGFTHIGRTSIKQTDTEFWFCWYQGQGGWFLPIQNLRHLKYVHQLQNLFYSISGMDLIIKNN